ncbi:protein FAM83C [Lissotriton helveticus]
MFHHEAARRAQRSPGQLRCRVDELKNPWRQGSPLTLSHNESARLATDALLEQGEEGYLRALADEKELPFLSTLDIEYVQRHANVSSPAALQTSLSVEGPEEDGLSEQTSGTYFPMMSDIELPMLELGWPEIPLITKHSQTEVTVHFQRDRSNSIKDLLRSLISKAKTVIAIVMDLFTDVDIMCDLVAAASKRNVPVYLLLDEKNLHYFIEMWEKLDFKSIQVPNLRVRTLTGSTYCTKSGKKFSGQFLEKFILVDGEQVIAGTYSFSWIASQVHSNLVTLFIGKIVEDFDTEFRCLYAVSNKVDYFSNVDSKISPYSRPSIWNTQPIVRLAPELTPSNGSSSHSDSTVSSQKASPYKTSTSYKVINEDKHALPDFKNDGRGEVNGGFRANFINQSRRLSNPSTLADRDHSFGLHNLGLRTSLLSKSTPALNQFEPVPNFTLGTITESNPSQTEHKTGSKNANVGRIGHEEISKEQTHNISRNEKRMTLGHSHLDLMMSYRRINAGTESQQAGPKPSTTVKSNVSRFQADIGNPTQPIGRNDVSKEKNSTINEDKKTMTLGHSKLDMITKFRPQTTNNLHVENLASPNVKSDSSLNQSTDSNYTENKRDVPTNSADFKASLGGNQTTLSSDEKTMTLGHSKLDMITKFRPQTTNNLQVENLASTNVKSDSSQNKSTNSNNTEKKRDVPTNSAGFKASLGGNQTTLNSDEKTMTLGHSKLDMITKFRPKLTNKLQVENLASTNVKSDSSLNQSTNSNYTENKRDVPTSSAGFKASLGGNQTTLNSDEKTMTLGHSRLDMITKCRPQTTAGISGLQPEYKTPTVLKSDGSANDSTDVSRAEEAKDSCTNHVGLKDDFKESNNLSRSDKRMTLGHSKLDMITNHNKGKPTKAYSRFRP